ncbi:pyruvate carboxylase domain protein [Mycobacterium intracellulare]|nr:pyruvate carboxylase domain protein [Mycobacterium intracellulare]
MTVSGSSSSRTGTPAEAISFLASILEPIARTASTGGPIQVSPACWTAAAKSAFSERKP